MTSGPRAIAVGLVLHPTNLVQPLMSELAPLDLVDGPGRPFRSSATRFQPARAPDRAVLLISALKAIALYEQHRERYRERVEGDLPREEPS
jgi:hypothetical protein